ncbi:MAG: TraR/DksA family transcriptional regulator, partial [Planctomycetota bacterium]
TDTTPMAKKVAKKMAVNKPVKKKTTTPSSPTSSPKAKSKVDKLTPSEIEECQQNLLMKRNLIVGDLSKMEIAALRASEQDSSLDNLADFGSDNYEQDFTLGLIENVEGVVLEIDNALHKLEGEGYGICEDCECTIPKARLMAIPYARYCIQCQSERERS